MRKNRSTLKAKKYLVDPMKQNIYAHRGLPKLAPENTMAGFEMMPEFGIKWFETDIAITEDGELVICHDDLLDRTTNLTGEISSLPYRYIETADAGSWFGKKYAQEKLPTMDDLVSFINRTKMNVNLEVKGISGENGFKLLDILVAKFTNYLEDIDPEVEILISSFNPILLSKVHEKAPTYKYALLFEDYTFNPDWQLLADCCGASAIHMEDVGLTKEKVEQVKKRGHELNVWTVDNSERAQELFNWGVDGIFTNCAHTFFEKV